MNQVATTSPRRDLAASIERMRGNFAETLPPGVDPDRFTRVAMNVIQTMPELVEQNVDRQSIFNSCLRAAQLGLMPDKREGAIVVVNEKRKGPNGDQWVKVAQFRDMIGGLRKLASEFGFDLIARTVYEHDHFDYQCGDEESISHKPPKLGDARGKMLGCYAIATRLRDGQKYRLVMDMEQIHKRRDVAQTKSVWDKWPAEMGEKTVGRALFKVLPLSEDDAGKLERFERLVTKEDEIEVAGEQASAAAQESQQTPTGPRRPRGLDTVAAAGNAAQEPPAGVLDGEYTTVIQAEPVEQPQVAGEPAPTTSDKPDF